MSFILCLPAVYAWLAWFVQAGINARLFSFCFLTKNNFYHRKMNPMHFSRTLSTALIGLCALFASTSRPASAQNLVYTLSDVTFADGAVVTGYFDYNPTTQMLGSYDFLTTNGTTDGLVGAHYLFGTSYTQVEDGGFFSGFIFGSGGPNAISFVTNGVVSGPGTFALLAGTVVNPTQLQFSGEVAPTARAIDGGSLMSAAAVPEASTTVSFGLLLALGLGGVVIAAKKKKARVSA